MKCTINNCYKNKLFIKIKFNFTMLAYIKIHSIYSKSMLYCSEFKVNYIQAIQTSNEKKMK